MLYSVTSTEGLTATCAAALGLPNLTMITIKPLLHNITNNTTYNRDPFNGYFWHHNNYKYNGQFSVIHKPMLKIHMYL